jgi:hypothetical protein
MREYDPGTRELTVTINGIAKQAVTGDIRVSIMLTESGIVDAQDDNENGGIVNDYVHKHVLRDMLTPATGATIANSLSAGGTFSYTNTIVLKEEWNAQEMEIVAFISNVQGEVFPVVQATTVPVIE